MTDHQSDHAARKPNRLINEPSPYLRQHAYNPIDWYPWGEEALARAKAEHRPILLSIGYSACHWCHVMERESFENEEIARAMNRDFVPIKVDREERPDLDQIYMDAVQLIAGRGGWPLTVFLTPEGTPFYGGTYFPPVDRQGMPGFGRVLAAIAQAWREQSDTIGKNVASLAEALRGLSHIEPSQGEPRAELAQAAARALAGGYDSVNGGIGGAPKFPNPFVFSLFLRVVDADADLTFADMVSHTLTKMAKGGIFDQLGGGFHRYSVDDRWLVPHFEKMLYDNALLARLYLDAGRALRDPEFLGIARRIFDYVLREMTSAEGGFYSSQDADSEGGEGRFFIWSVDDVRTLLGPERSPIAERYFDITEEGNFEGSNILHRTIDLGETARLFHKSEAEMQQTLEEIVGRMFAAREKRVKPGRDDKILAAWNAMMIGALAEGYRALGERRYLEAAIRAADFAIARLWDSRRLHRSYKDGAARFNAYLEDYALMTSAMIDVYEAARDVRYLDHAGALAAVMLERFLDRDHGGFYFTSDDHEALIVRAKPSFDGSTPSGNSAAAMALLRLHAYTGEERYLTEAERVIRLYGDQIAKQPFAFAHLLEAVDLYQRGAVEIVLVRGSAGEDELAQWIARVGKLYIPNRAVFVADGGGFLPEAARGRPAVDGKLTAYLCRERTCSAPITSIDALEAELRD
jgi:uncharacterized protein YyaL (SSP411 family)